MIGCPGPGTKRLVGLHRVRPSLAAVCIHFQPGRSGSPEAWYTLARTCRAVQRARPHGDADVIQQGLGVADTTGLPAREEEAQRHAVGVAAHVNFGSQATATAA